LLPLFTEQPTLSELIKLKAKKNSPKSRTLFVNIHGVILKTNRVFLQYIRNCDTTKVKSNPLWQPEMRSHVNKYGGEVIDPLRHLCLRVTSLPGAEVAPYLLANNQLRR